MGKEIEHEEPIDLEELLISTTFELEAVVEILIEKKLITKEEILTKMKKISKEID